jgi:hypothetical protein
MAHFARIDKNTKKVIQVHCVDDINLQDPVTKQESEATGIAYLLDVHKNQAWINDVFFVQTSYNNTIRKNYAGPGFDWDTGRNAFIPIKPTGNGKEYILDEETCRWEESAQETQAESL